MEGLRSRARWAAKRCRHGKAHGNCQCMVEQTLTAVGADAPGDCPPTNWAMILGGYVRTLPDAIYEESGDKDPI